MSNEDKMREEFELLREDFESSHPEWKYADTKAIWFWFWKTATERCAAIKDAEIARQMTIQVEWAELARKQEEDIASRDAVIKELREALHNIHCNWDEMYPEDIDKVITEALANSEHHNSHALDKMLLEAELNVLKQAAGMCTPYDQEFQHMITNRKEKLAELNKE